MLALRPWLRPDIVLTAAIAVVVMCIGWFAANQIVADDSRKAVVVAICFILAPVLGYLALRRPIVFPFAVYAALIPFDNLLRIGSFGTITRLLGAFAGAAIVLQLVLKRDAVLPARPVLLWGLLVAWMGVTVFWAMDSDAAVAALATNLQLYLSFAVVAIYPIRSIDHKILLGAIIAGGLCAALYGDYLYHNGSGVAAQRLFMRGLDNASGHVDPNQFAASLIIPLSLAAMMFLRCKFSVNKFLLLGAVATLLTGFIISGSRGGIVAVVAMMLFFLLRSRYKAQLALASIISALFLAPTALITRFQIAASTGGSGRFDIWRTGLAAFKDHWLIGAGVGNYPFAYDQVFINVYHSGYFAWHRVAHDLILQYGVELGIVGVLLLFAACFSQFRQLDHIGEKNALYDLRIALQGALLGLFVASLFLGIMNDKYPWLLFGLMALAKNLTLTRSGEQRTQETHEVRRTTLAGLAARTSV